MGWIFDWIFSLDNFWLELYLIISLVFIAYFLVRIIYFSSKEVMILLSHIVWGVLFLPILLGLLWPISLINRIVMKRWIANWMNNIHWWEE